MEGSNSTHTAKGRGTRERIVEVAAVLMHRQGVAGTTTPAVRREAEVSSSQIYHYFTDKDDLTRAVVAHQIARVVSSQSADLGRVDDVVGLFAWRDGLIEAAGAVQGAGGCPIGSLAGELADENEGARQALADGLTAWQRALHDALARILGDNDASGSSAANGLAWALLAAVQGGLLLAQTTRSTHALEAGINAVLAQVVIHSGSSSGQPPV